MFFEFILFPIVDSYTLNANKEVESIKKSISDQLDLIGINITMDLHYKTLCGRT